MGSTAASAPGTALSESSDPTVGSSSEGSPTDPACGDVVHDGDLVITDATLSSDADNITLVRGNVIVQYTTNLVDLTALAAVRCVEGYVQVDSNAALTSLDGLDNLRRVDAFVSITDNPALSNASGLGSLAQSSGLALLSNPLLVEFPLLADGFWLRGPAGVGFGDNGFEDLSGLLEIPGLTVTGTIEVGIRADDVMHSTYGLEALGGTDGPIDISLSENPGNDNALEEIDLTGFTRLRRLSIGSSFPNVHTILAPDLARIGFLELRGLDGLTDLSGFSALEEASTVRIGCGDVSGGGFTSLAGLEGLAVSPQLIVAASPNLVSLDALSTSLGTEHLAIINNALLPGTNADAYAAAVGSADAVICGNLGQPSCGWYDCSAGE